MRILPESLVSRYRVLSYILGNDTNKEFLLGVQRNELKDNDLVFSAKKVLEYSRSSGYESFAKELWADVTECIDKLCDGLLMRSQVDFYRGKLSKTLDILRKSYEAEFKLMEMTNAREKKEKEKIHVGLLSKQI